VQALRADAEGRQVAKRFFLVERRREELDKRVTLGLLPSPDLLAVK